jgi:hypothetical protein
MKYTLTVWIDFEGESREEAVEITDELRDAVTRAVRVFQPATVTAIESEWEEAAKPEEVRPE